MEFPNFILGVLLVSVTPIVLCTVFALLWAHKSASRRLAWVLRASTLFWVTVLLISDTLFVLTKLTCRSSGLVSFDNCSYLPDWAAENIYVVTSVSHSVAITWAALLLVIGVVIEYNMRRNAPTSSRVPVKN